METMALILVLSILLNVLTLRWALHEYAIRRQWQQDATALQHTLRNMSGGSQIHSISTGLVTAVLITGLLVLGLAFMVFFQ
jgi:hypothetical protein